MNDTGIQKNMSKYITEQKHKMSAENPELSRKIQEKDPTQIKTKNQTQMKKHLPNGMDVVDVALERMKNRNYHD